MGWDAFGLPAENAAKAKQDASQASGPTPISRRCAASCKSMGLSLDWSRELATCDVELLPAPAEAVPRHPGKAGLVDRKNSKVNWDPVDETVLANEQVIDGRGWRSGALVEQRELTQWFFKITDYAQDLLTARHLTAGPKKSG
jgi:leucyl-tRNA synthetase